METRLAKNETIVVVHGFGSHRWIMWPLAERLRHSGYQVLNWGYRSLTRDLAFHGANLLRTLQQLETSEERSRLHVVAHSMGCIVTRQALLDTHLPKLDKVIMLCPPNRGSHMATRCATLLGWLSTTLTEITDRPDSFVNSLPDSIACPVDLGILAARNDWIVAPESTRLSGALRYSVIPGFHSGILFRRQTAQCIAHFVQRGSFD